MQCLMSNTTPRSNFLWEKTTLYTPTKLEDQKSLRQGVLNDPKPPLCTTMWFYNHSTRVYIDCSWTQGQIRLEDLEWIDSIDKLFRQTWDGWSLVSLVLRKEHKLNEVLSLNKVWLDW